MSLLVLHMDKFKKDAIRGIQSHNRRERESHSNPDIDYGKSADNYDLAENQFSNYGPAIQNRIGDLLMVKVVRKDAVHMCGIVISSDREFFDKLSEEETRRFFKCAANYLTEFLGKENVISAMIHMDEKTPHMHFLHVPVTKDGRLCAKDIYTKAALKKLQDEMPKFLQEHGFKIERGVEQEKGSAKKHLDTKEFKQQQEMLKILQAEADNLRQSVKKMEEQLEEQKQEETDLKERIAKQKEFIAEIENNLNEKFTLRPANFFNYKEVLAEAEKLITTLKHALADKNKIAHENVQRVRQAEILLADRDQAKELAEKAVAVLQQERKAYDKLVKKLKAEKQTSEQEALCMRAFMVVKGFIDNYEKFQREWQARQAAANEASIRKQSQMVNSSGRPRMR